MSEEYFKQVYRADPLNASKQPEAVYLDYALGRRGLAVEKWKGLVSAARQSLSRDVFSRVNERLWKLANRAFGEWAKDNDVRAFDEQPLRNWADKLKKESAQDPGDGSRINSFLDQVDRELASFILKRGLPLL